MAAGLHPGLQGAALLSAHVGRWVRGRVPFLCSKNLQWAYVLVRLKEYHSKGNPFWSQICCCCEEMFHLSLKILCWSAQCLCFGHLVPESTVKSRLGCPLASFAVIPCCSQLCYHLKWQSASGQPCSNTATESVWEPVRIGWGTAAGCLPGGYSTESLVYNLWLQYKDWDLQLVLYSHHCSPQGPLDLSLHDALSSHLIRVKCKYRKSQVFFFSFFKSP